MKSIHLFRVELGPEAFAPLVAAARDAGGRVGWLDLRPADPPPRLEAAAAAGVLRAVAAGGRRTVAVKPLRGEPVLRDLLREHFRGCAAVLVAGEVEGPLLAPDGDGWLLTVPGGHPRRLSTPDLLALLRKPRPL